MPIIVTAIRKEKEEKVGLAHVSVIISKFGPGVFLLIFVLVFLFLSSFFTYASSLAVIIDFGSNTN